MEGINMDRLGKEIVALASRLLAMIALIYCFLCQTNNDDDVVVNLAVVASF